MARPDPKKFCCEQMEAEWKAGVVGWQGRGVGILVTLDASDYVDTGLKPIAFCPWCGLRFKVKDD